MLFREDAWTITAKLCESDTVQFSDTFSIEKNPVTKPHDVTKCNDFYIEY